MRSTTITGAAQRVAAVLLAGASLVCGPAVVTTPPAVAPIVVAADPAVLALVAGGPAPAPAPAPVPVAAAPAPAATTPAFAFPTRPELWFAPSGKNQGTQGLAMFLAGIALVDNAPLYISEQTSRTTGSTSSDHYFTRTDSWAVDVAVRGIQQPTPATHTAAKRISAALGEENWAGGDLTRTIDGYRIQVLWLVAGHYNHVHVGVRKVA